MISIRNPPLLCRINPLAQDRDLLPCLILTLTVSLRSAILFYHLQQSMQPCILLFVFEDQERASGNVHNLCNTMEQKVKYTTNIFKLNIPVIDAGKFRNSPCILPYLLSPTRRTGYTVLNETWFKDALLLETICWLQIGWYLSTFKSNIWALPSKVTAAKTVLENGDHATSPTSQLRSNMKRGSL